MNMILDDRFSYPASFYRDSEELLEIAFKKTPFYKSWASFDLGSSVSLDRRYDALPHLDKEAMRNSFPRGLLPCDRNLEAGLASDEAEYTFTSGTTSDKVINIFSPAWWSASEKSSWKLNKSFQGIPYPPKTAKLASSLNVGINCEEDLDQAHRTLGNNLYLSEKTNLIQVFPRHYERMIAELNSFRPDIIEANPSLLARLCNYAFDHKKTIVSPKAIVFTYEFISETSLRAIRRIFSAPFISSYGSTETGFVLEQGEDGLMYQNVDFCRLDFIPLAAKYQEKDLGTIVVSTFHNPWNIIIRFEVGDLVRLHPDANGHQGMVIEAVEGRNSNVTFALDGRIVTTGKADKALSAVASLRDYHLEQLTRSSYLLQALLEPGTDPAQARKELQEQMKRLYGSAGDYNIEIKDDILPGPAGKFRRTQCNFAFSEKELFQ
jgi:phenylacetate-coenzyme A ligase PaaK-like adenylate-forming protein